MHLNQIKSFITVSQVLNFTNAARQNGVPQSTISRQINDLEQQLGVKLFYRTKRDVRLTQEGRAFLPYAQEILDAAKKGAFAVRQLHEGAEGRLSIATIDDSDQFLAMCLQEFSRKYPGIIVDLTYVSHGEPLQSEVDDPYDFHFHYLDMIPDSEEYEIRAVRGAFFLRKDLQCALLRFFDDCFNQRAGDSQNPGGGIPEDF